MSQEYQQRPRRGEDGEEAPVTQEAAQTRPSDEAFDSLLDEIDDVLESNAEEFVRSFVQKGGQ